MQRTGQKSVARGNDARQRDAVHPLANSTRQLLIVILLPLAVLVVFWPGTRNGFVNYDDPTYVLNNPRVQAGFTPGNTHWAWTTGYAGNWHPLTWFSHMADCKLFGLEPGKHHLVSIVLHAINTLLAYLALRQFTGSTWRSLCVAALFGLHPLRVESVAWVSERKDVLSTLLWLATLWAYAVWIQWKASTRRGAWCFYILALAFLALGLMSKPMLVTLPCVLLLLDYWPLRRMRPLGLERFWKLAVEKLPFLALAVAASVVTVIVQRQAGAVKSTEIFAFPLRMENAVVSYVSYLGKFFYPVHLAVYYPYRESGLSVSLVLLCGLLLLTITGVAVWQRRERPWMLVGWLWYLGALVPAIGLVQVGTQAMADRYTYIPLLGFAVALVWTVHDLASRWRMPAVVTTAVAVVGVAACAVLSRVQIGYWQSSETLFRHALAVTDKNAVAHTNLGIALGEKGAVTEAISELQAALAIAPRSSSVHLNLGVLLDATGRTGEAIEQFLQATEADPNLADAYLYLGRAFQRQQRLPGAIAAYQQALRINPGQTETRFNLGLVYFGLGRFEEARGQFLEVVRQKPDYADAYDNLGSALFSQGRLDEARPYYEKALQLQPGHPDARRNLAALIEAMAARPQH